MVDEIRDQYEAVPTAETRRERITGSRFKSRVNPRRFRMFLRDGEHWLPIDGRYADGRVSLREHDAVHPVTGRDVEHLGA